MGTVAKRILIVDDEENTQLGLSKLLSQEGFIVDLAAKGTEALEVLRRQRINLVISDINMPLLEHASERSPAKTPDPEQPRGALYQKSSRQRQS